MLGLARHRGDTHALPSAKHVDERRLADVRITYGAHVQPVVRVLIEGLGLFTEQGE